MPTNWEIMKQSADTTEEKKEFEEIERNSELNNLESMKRDQIRVRKGGYVRADGSKASYKEFAETNVPLRKRAEKIFKTKEAVNKFMLAKDWTNTSRD
tara:strand:- start:1009 stop:1302 length:294 start_codon:yes stop_codon:yes gene_type:complete